MATTNSNDKTILALKKQIEKKRGELKKAERFSPITNCSLELDGQRYNIQVLSKEQLVHVLVKMNLYQMSAKTLGILDDYVISGFKVNAWMTDLQARLAYVDKKLEADKLRKMEEKLHQLLSVDKKVELEIEDIKSSLGEMC